METITKQKRPRIQRKKREINDLERSKGRSENYYQMSPQEQWDDDKKNKLLDWDGK